MAADPLRAVVVGGHIGRQHAAGYQASEATNLVAVCDIDPATLEAFGDEFDVSARYTVFDSMLREVEPDLISICTPQWLHASMTIHAAQTAHPKAILCEKGMANNMGEAIAMVNVCDREGVKLAIGHQGRFMPRHEQVREMLADGTIGTPLTAWSATGKPESGLMNIGTHALSYLHFMLGDPKPEWMIANVERSSDRWERSWPAEGRAAVLIQFDNGVRLTLESDLPAGGLTRSTRVFVGTDGMISLPGEMNNNAVRLLRGSATAWEDVDVPVLEFPDARVREVTALARWATGEIDEHRGDAHLALDTQAMLMGIYESARGHARVDFPLKTMASPLVAMINGGDLPVRYPGRNDIRHVTPMANA